MQGLPDGDAMGKPVVGLDIEPGYVAAVQAAPGGVAVERAAGAALPPGSCATARSPTSRRWPTALQGAVRRAQAVQARCGSAWPTSGSSCGRSICRRSTDAKQLASAVRFQAQDHIPMPLDQAVLEHHSLGTVETPDGPRTRVVLVAARRDMIAAPAGGRPPSRPAPAGHRPLRLRHDPRAAPARPRRARTLYLSVGGMTNLAIAEGTHLRLHPHDRARHRGAGQRARRAARPHARARPRLAAPRRAADADRGRRRRRGDRRRGARGAGRRACAGIADEVRNTLDFHRAQSGVRRRVEPRSSPARRSPSPASPSSSAGEIGLPFEVGLVAEARPGRIRRRRCRPRWRSPPASTVEEVTA